METLTLLGLGVMPLTAIMAGVRDLTTMTIPNWMSGLLILAFFPVAWLAGLPLPTVAVHMGVAVGVLFVGAGLFALRVIGGGDAKLMAALSLWLGLSGLAPFIVWTALFGGALSILLLAARGRLGALAGRAPGWLRRLLEPGGGVPYGVAIAGGALMAFPSSALMGG